MRLPPVAFIAAICLAHVFTMVGFSTFPALLTGFMAEWSMSTTQAGAVNSALLLGYTVAVPILVAITDRIDTRRIYIVSAMAGGLANLGFAMFARDVWSASLFSTIYGVSLAGTYMPGLRVLGEHLPPATMSRATGFYTSSFSLGAAISYVLSDQLAGLYGWQIMFFMAAGTGLAAALIMLIVAGPCTPHVTGGSWLKTLDPRPVLRNRSAIAYSLVYALHSYELFTVRSWLVAFLAIAAGGSAMTGLWAPAMIAGIATAAGVFASIGGNELSIRLGRRKAISLALVLAGCLSIALPLSVQVTYALVAVLALVHGFVVMLDSASVTAGAFGSARPEQRGITMAVHSTLGFGGAMIGPLVFGVIVDAGGNTQAAWQLAYAHLAIIMVLGLVIMAMFRPAALPGDRNS